MLLPFLQQFRLTLASKVTRECFTTRYRLLSVRLLEAFQFLECESIQSKLTLFFSLKFINFGAIDCKKSIQSSVFNESKSFSRKRDSRMSHVKHTQLRTRSNVVQQCVCTRCIAFVLHCHRTNTTPSAYFLLLFLFSFYFIARCVTSPLSKFQIISFLSNKHHFVNFWLILCGSVATALSSTNVN